MLRTFLVKRTLQTSANTVQWNKTLRNHQANRNYEQALKLFQIGVEKRTFEPNAVTCITMLDICKEMKSLSTLRTIHQWIDTTKASNASQKEIYNNPRVRSLLMDVYIKCQDLDGAQQVFQSMNEHNLIDYSALMTGFNQQRQYERTLQLSKQIPSKMLFSSPILCTLVLQACSELQRYDDGEMIHRSAAHLLSKDKILMNELMNFYLKFHKEQQALAIFEQHHVQRTVIDYSTFMKYYNRRYQPEKTIDFYNRLKGNARLPMDHIIYVLVLQAIGNGCCLRTSEQIRESVNKFQSHIDIGNVLINMYGNCEPYEFVVDGVRAR